MMPVGMLPRAQAQLLLPRLQVHQKLLARAGARLLLLLP